MQLDFEAMLNLVGLERVYPEDAKSTATIEAKTSLKNSLLTLEQVRRGGASWLAGLTAGDVVVAINGRRISSDLETTLAQYQGGDEITISYFRRDRLQNTTLKLGSTYNKDPKVQVVDAPSDAQKAMFKAWMGVSLTD